MSSDVATVPAVRLPEAPPRLDFPGWMPPMLVKELRQGLRQRGFVGGLIAAQAVLVIMFATGFATDTGNGSSSRSMIDGFFWCTMFATLLLLAPLRALSALSAELEGRTMDLLLLTRLDSWRIVWGKWVSLMAQSLLLAVALLPYAVVRYFFGAVGILQDLAIIAYMLAACGAFTAAGLWASGMNRVVKMLLVIAMILVSFSVFGGMLSRRMFMGGSIIVHSSGSMPGWLGVSWMVWTTAAVIAYFLMMAVRWFAPLAENHAIGPRLIPLALAAPFPVLAWVGGGSGMGEAIASWLVVCGVIALIEMASAREVLAIHLRGRLGKGGVWRVIGSALLPGWPSAALWLALLLASTGLAWGIVDWRMTNDLKTPEMLWLGVLAWTGLVFPAVLVSLVPSAGRVAGVLYFILHILLGIFAMMAGSDSLSQKAPAVMLLLDWISHAVPTTSFWHAVNELDRGTELVGVGFGQSLGVAVTLALMIFTARRYWVIVRHFRSIRGKSANQE
jgi:hypothetical protein